MRRSLSSFDFYNFTTSTVESCITTPLCFGREKTSVSHFQYGHTTFMLKDTENYVLPVIHMSRQVICFFFCISELSSCESCLKSFPYGTRSIMISYGTQLVSSPVFGCICERQRILFSRCQL